MLILENLETGYAGTPVLTIPQLIIPKNSRCLIKGNSGSGKTTLLYAMAGIGELQSGKITLNGTSLYGLSEQHRDVFRGQSIGIVFQTLHLIRSLNVLQNIELGASLMGKIIDKDYLLHLLQRLGIENIINKSAHHISQGQAQRVAIVRALVLKPQLILADEPTSSLDDTATKNVMEVLCSLADERQTTLVVASHDERITSSFNQVYDLGKA